MLESHQIAVLFTRPAQIWIISFWGPNISSYQRQDLSYLTSLVLDVPSTHFSSSVVLSRFSLQNTTLLFAYFLQPLVISAEF